MERHKKLAFYGVPSTVGGGYVFKRMKYFTQFGINKNAVEHNRKYVDEATNRNDVVGYDTSIAYAFDDTNGDPVLEDIISITTLEKTGTDSVRPIILVDTNDNSAVMRDFAVIPGSEGDDANTYTHSGTFKAHGELTTGTATIAADGQSATFTEDSNGG